MAIGVAIPRQKNGPAFISSKRVCVGVIRFGWHFVAHAADGSGGDSDEAFHGVVGGVVGLPP